MKIICEMPMMMSIEKKIMKFENLIVKNFNPFGTIIPAAQIIIRRRIECFYG
jgi:hypothetical protein